MSSVGRVPRYFSVRIDHPEAKWIIVMSVAIEPDGSAVCTSLGSSRRAQDTAEHAWVQDVLAELPGGLNLRRWVQYAVAIAAKVEETGLSPLDWPAWPEDLAGPSEALAHWQDIAFRQAEQRAKRRKQTDATRLDAVALQYKRAMLEGRHDPTKAVAEAQRVSRSQAAKLVSQARKANKLEPAKPGRAGG